MADISIRQFADGDVAAFATLMDQLGYPSTVDQMRSRMARIASRPDYATFVAEEGGEIVGMVGAFVTPSYEHDEPIGRITAMVVAEGARGKGVGAGLIAAAEAWGRERGASMIAVNSHVRRTGAHAFYRRLGYEENGKRFVKRF